MLRQPDRCARTGRPPPCHAFPSRALLPAPPSLFLAAPPLTPSPEPLPALLITPRVRAASAPDSDPLPCPLSAEHQAEPQTLFPLLDLSRQEDRCCAQGVQHLAVLAALTLWFLEGALSLWAGLAGPVGVCGVCIAGPRL